MTALKSRLSPPPPALGAEASSDPPDATRAKARYQELELLAAGGMGVVYRALDRVTGRALAMKRLAPQQAGQTFSSDAFAREYHVLASLDHPRIIRVFDYGVDERGPYYTMELLAGKDMREAAPLRFKKACLYLRDIATSLSLLHARRLIHRDLSPSNVRMTDDGRCKLLDFGALTDFGQSPMIVGTPPAIAPEVLDGLPLDHRVDLYALGALAYWMLTGKHAYPARHIHDLRGLWRLQPAPPSVYASDIPPELDALVMSLLRGDPRARPGSAGEVIARLNVIAELTPEATTGTDRLAQSFLANPRFTGRVPELQALQALTSKAMQGSGAALRIQAVAGMGRSRLLEESGVRAQLLGATVLRVDAGGSRQLHGTTQALVMRLLDAAPELAREPDIDAYRLALMALGPDVERRLRARPSDAPRNSLPPREAAEPIIRPLQDWFALVSGKKPLVIQVDNVDYADDASLGLLAALASMATSHRILLLMTERLTRAAKLSIGRQALQTHAASMPLTGLSDLEMSDLVRSLFGETPHLGRFAEWLHERTAGSPLHAVEICRRLVVTQVIQFCDGIWTLPSDRPDAELSLELSAALSIRLAGLRAPARELAECLSLQREQPTFELCRRLSNSQNEHDVRRLLDELASNDVLHLDGDVYRFSSAALCETLLSEMDELQLLAAHRRLGETFAELAGTHNPALSIQAGWHLMQGGDDLRGAGMVAAVANNAATVRDIIAQLHRAGQALEMALQVYARYRRPVSERLPLLAALAHAGYYEDRVWGERYGDQALDALEDMVGLRSAQRLRPVLGRWLSLGVGMLFGFIRFQLLPRAERKYSFRVLLVHLFGAVTTLTGIAAISLDAKRAERVADVLEPFAMLPERLTPVGIYQLCRGLVLIAREHPAEAYSTFDLLSTRFSDRSYYPSLPSDARQLYVAATHFARAAFAIFRAHSEPALAGADALDATGWKFYAMIASQLRFLYYTNRGEFAKAAPHRQQVELHAVQVGSAWQVELWEAPALLLIHTALADIVGATRLAHRLETQSRTAPSLKLYSQLSKEALALARGEASFTRLSELTDSLEPRSYIGWAAAHGFLARSHNSQRRYAEAKAICERTLSRMTDADREYVTLFLAPEVELAIADAGLGMTAQGLQRIDALLERFQDCDHPLAHGLLHEARARIAWSSGDRAAFARGLVKMEAYFLPTGSPELIARCELLAQLANPTADEISTRLATIAPSVADAASEAHTQAMTRAYSRE
jgi:hypothetical protein